MLTCVPHDFLDPSFLSELNHKLKSCMVLMFGNMQNDISDVLDLTFSMDADEEKLILYERAEVRAFTCAITIYPLDN